MWTRSFALAVVERALKSFAQCLLGLWLGDAAFDLIQVDWVHSLGLAGGAALLSVLTSVVSAPFSPTGSPSLLAPDATAGRHARPDA